jgi:membrane-associated phospholipid phosphatase
LLAGILILAFDPRILPVPPTAEAAGLLDVPLKSWTYFEPYRDWTYTAVEKLVTAGLVGPWVLNTRPMSRMEMARVVAMALRKIQEDETGWFARRTDLEPTLYTLMEEFAPELEAMAVRTGEDRFAGQPWLQLQPLSHLQARAFAVRRDVNPENSQGLKLARRYDGTVGFDSYIQLSDFFSGYLYPEFQMDEHGGDGRLVEGYLKLKLNNVALRFGRESLWWGPGYHGSLMVGNNAPPLDQFRIGTAEPIILPWFLKYLGPTRMELLYARLEANRDHPHAVLGAWRVDFSPSPLLEIGAARTVQMGGEGRPSMSALDYLAALVISKDDPNSKFNTNQLYTLDATLRLHDVDRWFPLSRDLSLYAELEVDDTCCKNVIWPLKPAYMVGLYLPNLFGRPDSELRVEWAATTSFAYTHGIYRNGFSFEGFPLAHYIAAQGQDLYIRTAERILPNLQLGTELGFAKVGSTEIGQVGLPREKRNYLGLDISYQPTKALSMLFGYRYERVDNKDFVAGRTANNHTLRLEATYSLPAWEKGLVGRARRAEALRPVTPPPAPRAEGPPGIDREEIFSVNYAARVLKDAGTTLTSPLRWDARDWVIFSGVAATTGGLMFADKGIRGFVQKHRSDTSDTLANVFRPFEEIVPVAFVAGMAGTGYAFDRPRLKAAAADALEASLISVGVFSMPMKFFGGRARPDRNLGSAHYQPLNLGSSFPSFTAANAFAVASVLTEHFPHPAVSALAYGLAGAAGLARVYDNKHWTSDVFLGATIGILVGKTVAKLNEERREKSRVGLIPLVGQGIQGAAVRVEF